VTVALLIFAAVAAVGDWVAVYRQWARAEYALKPLTLALLVAAAAGADLGNAKVWVVAGLALGLLGDIGLMLSRGDEADPPFLAGLGAFLIGHLCYLVAFLLVGVRAIDVVAGLLVVVGVSAVALPKVLRGAAQQAGRTFAGIVGAYAAVLGAMAVLAVGTGIVATAIGGVLFLVSDTVIAWQRFVRHIGHGDVVVIVTYHLAQFLILLGLVRTF
jgi:uncharacterized membrane protein YhhN